MAKVVLICGKICSGKTEYAKSLLRLNHTVLLSVDEITLALFGTDTGEEHNSMVEKTQKYLFQKSIQIIGSGINVVLDWGFWTHDDRQEATSFYKEHGIDFEWHYLDISNEQLKRNLNKRNKEIEKKNLSFYYFDNDLAEQFWDMFEVPLKEEIYVWVSSYTE